MRDKNDREIGTIAEVLEGNKYPGRGILLGVTPDGRKAVTVYFIMGRSENSRNRVFVPEGSDLKVKPFDESKVGDPSLVIYTARRCITGTMAEDSCQGATAGDVAADGDRRKVTRLIVTNGDQTDTVADAYLRAGDDALSHDGVFESALFTRTFEPDPPIFTPRISGMIELVKYSSGVEAAAAPEQASPADPAQAGCADVSYKLSILKRANGDKAARYFYNYPGIPGRGHLIHTYENGADPTISFHGEPRLVATGEDLEAYAREVWNALDEDNRVSLFAAFTDIATGKEETLVINKNAM